MIRRHIRLTALVMAFAIIVATCGSDSTELAGYTRDPEPNVGHVSLPAVNRDNVDFNIRAEPNELLLVYFGFANCPDICPTTLADTRRALDELDGRAEAVNLALITIDPARDTPQIVSDYVEAFIDGSIALRTDDDDRLLEAADAFGVTYLVEENDAGEIEVGHTPNLFVVDDQGALVLTWPFGVPADDIASDLRFLLDQRA